MGFTALSFHFIIAPMARKTTKLLYVFLFFIVIQLTPQEKTDNNLEKKDLVHSTMAMDIAESDYYALVAWVKQLGLPDTGNAQELRNSLYAYYSVNPAAPDTRPKTKTDRVITINSADSTEYIKIEEDDSSKIRLAGRVNISVSDPKSGETLNLKADKVLFDNNTNILNASSDVRLERKKADGSIDIILAENMELNIDDLAGLFVDAKSSQEVQEAGKKAVFFNAEEISKLGSDVMLFKDALVSSCEEDNPHYSIRASKLWILGNNEWAMLDATLFAGEVPILYVPFFYYPGEEIVFNPVFGFDERFGYYVQTTTYLLGTKEAKEQTISLLKIADNNKVYEKKLEGVFLRSTKNVMQKKNNFIKVMADVYSNLGVSAALEAKGSELGSIKNIYSYLGLGLSRSVFYDYANGAAFYTPFIKEGDYKSIWNRSKIPGAELPFRFALNLDSTIKLGLVNINLSFPFYSDPYFNKDFKNRSEHMDWLLFLEQEKEDKPIGLVNNFIDSINMNASFSKQEMPSFLAWISSFSINRFYSSLNWLSKRKPVPIPDIEKRIFTEDPFRDFFIPDEWVILDSSATVSGTIFKYPAEKTGQKTIKSEYIKFNKDIKEKSYIEVPWLEKAMKENSEPKLPWPTIQKEKPEISSYDNSIGFSAPTLLEAVLYPERKPPDSTLSFSISPSVNWKLKFQDKYWVEPEDIDWALFYETRSLRNASTLNFSGNAFGSLLNTRTTLTATNQFMFRPNLTDDENVLSQALKETLAKQDAQYRNDKISGSFNLDTYPLQDIWLFAPSKISYKFSTLLYEYAFSGMDPNYLDRADKAHYNTKTPEWTAGSINVHSLALGLTARPWGFEQSFTMSANLAPLSEKYSFTLALKYPVGNLLVQSSYAEDLEDGHFVWNPLNINMVLGENPNPVIKTAFSWDIENEKAKNFVFSFLWQGFSFSATALEGLAYKIKENLGWEPDGESIFRLARLDIGYKTSIKPPPSWKNRILWTLDIDSSANQSLLRFTDSNMDLKLGLTFKIHEFLDLSFSSISKNSSLWRYYPWLFGVPENITAVDPIFDLLGSFNFFDPAGEARRKSLFKLKSLSFSAIHKLHDWDLAFTFTASPVLVNDSGISKLFEFKSAFTVSLSWRDISQIKTSYKKELVGNSAISETWD